MKLKDFKEIISSIPEEFDDYEVIYSELEDTDKESYVRVDDILVGMVSDEENEKMCFMGEDSYKMAMELYTDYNENNNEENDKQT